MNKTKRPREPFEQYVNILIGMLLLIFIVCILFVGLSYLVEVLFK